MQSHTSIDAENESSGDSETSEILYRLSSPSSTFLSGQQGVEALGMHLNVPRAQQAGLLGPQVSSAGTKSPRLGGKCTDSRSSQPPSFPHCLPTQATEAAVSKSKAVDPGEYQSDDEDAPRTAETRPPYNLKSLLAMSEGNTDVPHTTLTRNKVLFFKEWQKLHPTSKDHHKTLDYKHTPYPPLRGSRRSGNDHRIVSSQSSEQFHPDSSLSGAL